jgi:hypothetical protein
VPKPKGPAHIPKPKHIETLAFFCQTKRWIKSGAFKEDIRKKIAQDKDSAISIACGLWEYESIYIFPVFIPLKIFKVSPWELLLTLV